MRSLKHPQQHSKRISITRDCFSSDFLLIPFKNCTDVLFGVAENPNI
jgi:hypothetical protein